MKDIEKLAELFHKQAIGEENEGDIIFGERYDTFFTEAERLKLFAGKLLYAAQKREGDKAEKIKSAAKLVLAASDILYKV